MKWKFWQRNGDMTQDGKSRLPRPRDLPEGVGRYLVVDRGMDPDQVWNLKAVTRPSEGSTSRHDIRIYNPVAADHSGITIRNYDSLDMYQEMILFEGWYDKKSNQVEITIKKMERGVAA
jgi:hypothetical protein